jgi:hypothetical protein
MGSLKYMTVWKTGKEKWTQNFTVHLNLTHGTVEYITFFSNYFICE